MGKLFDHNFRFIDLIEEEASEFYSWDSITPVFEYNSKDSFYELFVPTKDTIKYETMLVNAIKARNPIFLTGFTGCGKTTLV